jgi:anti-sigma factor RsiW
MMACRDCLDFLMDYLDGHLSPAQRAIFEEHLAVCNSCVAYLHSYRQTVKLAKGLSAGDQGQEVPEELVQNILAARAKG